MFQPIFSTRFSPISSYLVLVKKKKEFECLHTWRHKRMQKELSLSLSPSSELRAYLRLARYNFVRTAQLAQKWRKRIGTEKKGGPKKAEKGGFLRSKMNFSLSLFLSWGKFLLEISYRGTRLIIALVPGLKKRKQLPCYSKRKVLCCFTSGVLIRQAPWQLVP